MDFELLVNELKKLNSQIGSYAYYILGLKYAQELNDVNIAQLIKTAGLTESMSKEIGKAKKVAELIQSGKYGICFESSSDGNVVLIKNKKENNVQYSKEQIVKILADLYDSDIEKSAIGGIFIFKYGKHVVDKYTPTELMREAHLLNPNVKERYAAELNGAFLMYRYFQNNPTEFDASCGQNLQNIPELFAAYLKNEGKSEATVDRYVKQVPNNSEVQNIVQSIAGTTALFDVMDVAKLLQISQKVAAQDFDKKGGNMYSAGINAYTHFISNLNLFRKKIGQERFSTIQSKVTTIPPAEVLSKYAQYLTAIRTKPFVLLAGISGTGKSRIVRELARSCYEVGSEEYAAHKPKNFEMIQVKPNWHDSTELLGYVSRISGTPEFVAGDFLRFIVKAWENLDTPHFLCLDEMNLAPVEQYFAEYLSVIESRKLEDGKIVTDPILKPVDADWYRNLVEELTKVESIQEDFIKYGIPLPQNLFVIGTVNMDETTYSFSRKVLDRAMTIEMNEVDLNGGLQKNVSELGHIDPNCFKPAFVEGCDVYNDNKELCDKVISYLSEVNNILEGTPFKIAYRTRNEFLVYAVNRQMLAQEGTDTLSNALDEMTSMKILSRIEGDAAKTETVLRGLDKLLKDQGFDENGISLSKIKEMLKKLELTDYTGFWS